MGSDQREHRRALARSATLATTALALTYALFAPISAAAIFTRAFPREIAEIPSALPILRNVAIDGENNVWAAEVTKLGLGELDPGAIASPSVFVKTIAVSHFPTDLAIERATTGDFYVSGSDFVDAPIEVLSSSGRLL